jgi:hypothetical protein
VLQHRGQQAVLGERLGQVFAGADHAAAGAVEQAVLRRQHHHRGPRKARAALDQRAGLVAIEPRHQDVAEDDRRLVVVDLGQGLEAVLARITSQPACLRKISALRRMVFESSITITRVPRICVKSFVDMHVLPTRGWVSTSLRDENGLGAGRSTAARRPGSDLDHLEVLLAGSAFRTGPVRRDLLPGSARASPSSGSPAASS